MKTPDFVVKMLTNDDGDVQDSKLWHFVYGVDADRTLCGGEVFGDGESIAKFKTRKGKVTCDKCIEIIKMFKSVKL